MGNACFCAKIQREYSVKNDSSYKKYLNISEDPIDGTYMHFWHTVIFEPKRDFQKNIRVLSEQW